MAKTVQGEWAARCADCDGNVYWGSNGSAVEEFAWLHRLAKPTCSVQVQRGHERRSYFREGLSPDAALRQTVIFLVVWIGSFGSVEAFAYTGPQRVHGLFPGAAIVCVISPSHSARPPIPSLRRRTAWLKQTSHQVEPRRVLPSGKGS